MKLSLSWSGRTFISFWIFGLVNNVLYVVILSAAIDLVGPETPKAIVLLADILPSLIVKATAPFYIHIVPYWFRIYLLILLSSTGMASIAFYEGLNQRLFGIVLASASSGLGEISFLQLTHFYDSWSLGGFSSGTGAAGLVGSFVFLLLTSWIGISTKVALIVFSFVPFLFAVVYFFILPPANTTVVSSQYYIPVAPEVESEVEPISQSTSSSNLQDTIDPENLADKPPPPPFSIMHTLRRLRPLFLPFMLPLMLVYIGEYVINQGISPTLLFPLEEMPFDRYRDAYVTYGTLYQLGVFISRSSSSFFRVRRLYLPAFLQSINVVICIIQSMYMILPNVYFVMALVFYEGLLGGLAYVNTFLLVSETIPLVDREFAMGSVGISDTGGITVAAIISLFLEKSLCRFQQRTGRPWCELP